MYESICNAPLLQPKQSRVLACRPNRKYVFSLLQKSIINVNVGSRSDGGGRELVDDISIERVLLYTTQKLTSRQKRYL